MISPKEVNQHVEKLLDKINAEYEPELVTVKVEPSAKLNSCYFNVADKIKSSGGRIHYGWVIWQGDLLCEAEHHAVWEDSYGNLLCVTPRQMNVDTIMFVSDNDKLYEGVSIDNIRINISGNPIIDDFIAISEINEKLWLLGRRLNNQSVALPAYVSQQIKRNKQILHNIEQFVRNGGKRGSQCFCHSGKSFSTCHGKELSANAQSEFKRICQHHSGQISR